VAATARRQPTPHVRNPLLAYARWSVLARKRAALTPTTPFTPGTAEHARGKIRAALDLLTWLDADGTALADITQPTMDRYLPTTSGRRRVALRLFCEWATAHQLAPYLHIQTPTKSDPHVFLDDAQRTEVLRRCLTDPTTPTRLKIAGSLVVLFGLTIPRVAALTDQDIHTVGGKTFLHLTDKPLIIPPRLASLIVELAQQRRRRHADPSQTTPVLLFPGRRPSHPVHPQGLTRQLRAHGIPVQASRNTARATPRPRPPRARPGRTPRPQHHRRDELEQTRRPQLAALPRRPRNRVSASLPAGRSTSGYGTPTSLRRLFR
jgi:hypothetical protein